MGNSDQHAGLFFRKVGYTNCDVASFLESMEFTLCTICFNTLSVNFTFFDKQIGLSGNASNLYSQGARFESRPGHQLS
jgi:hypothetical protein